LNEENEEKKTNYPHIMSWLMFLLIWLIFIKTYSGYWLFDALNGVITVVLVLLFLRDVRREF